MVEELRQYVLLLYNRSALKEDKLDEFRQIIGEGLFGSFLKLLTEIGPDSRTHRISVVIAGILKFTLGRIAYDYERSRSELVAAIDFCRLVQRTVLFWQTRTPCATLHENLHHFIFSLALHSLGRLE